MKKMNKPVQPQSEIEEALAEGKRLIKKTPVNFNQTLSTGSTLLDLAISGGRKEGGGIPGGKMVEVFGPESVGKTAILAEIAASTQHKKKPGDVLFLDPESRLDEDYARIYGMKIPKDKYFQPDTVSQMFELYEDFQPDEKKFPGISVIAADSLAALSTDMEMEDEDKMGMRRAKEFSQGLRKFARLIAQPNRMLVCSNQMREGTSGRAKTPGGYAIRHYSSLRIQINQGYPKWRVTRTRKTRSGTEVDKVVGVISQCYVIKSSLDAPYREAPIYIIFDYGIDDVRGNLKWIKDMTKATVYDGLGIIQHASFMEKAIERIEEQELENKLRDEVIGLWNEIEDSFEIDRPRKSR